MPCRLVLTILDCNNFYNHISTYDTYEKTIIHKVFVLIRSRIRKDHHVILKDFGRAIEVKFGPRRNDYNKDLHFRVMTDIENVTFDTKWRIVNKVDISFSNNVIGFLANSLYKKQVPEYDVIFYLHGEDFYQIRAKLTLIT
jgi:hypothetical protein